MIRDKFQEIVDNSDLKTNFELKSIKTKGFRRLKEKHFQFDKLKNFLDRGSRQRNEIMTGTDYNRIIRKLIFSLREVNNYSFSYDKNVIAKSGTQIEKF